MVDPNTHLEIDGNLCGEVTELEEGKATITLVTRKIMCADGKGLVHGGFVFGAVDYAAMLAVNDPNVVLGSAEVRFVAPVKVGETVVAVATVAESRGKKRVLDVFASVGDRKVVSGTMTAFVLEDHVLEAR